MMKKIICLVLALVLCTALAIPALAEDAPTVVTPTNSYGVDEIVLTTPGNYFITKSCEVYLLYIMDCTLTVAEGVTVTVTHDISNMDGVLNIGSGAVLECCGDTIDNSGTMNVHGTVNFYPTDSNFKSSNFGNSGTLNVHGTVDISKCYTRSNEPFGTINLYTDGSIIGSVSGRGKYNNGLSCSEDHTVCDHAFADNHICTKCGYVNAELHKHDYTTGFTTGRCVCGEACPHAELDNGFCTACDYFDLSQHTHDFSNGDCRCGKTVCDVNGHTLNNGFCTVCNFFDSSQHTHDFTSGDSVGTCKCSEPCPHENWTEGVCDICHYACPHESWTGNECDVCHYVCQHTGGTTVICNCCGGVVSTTSTASTLSEGSLTIIVGIAAAVVFGLGGFFIGRKKKPALAGGTENTELSE